MEINEPKLHTSNWGRSEFDFLSWQEIVPDDSRGRPSTRQPHVPVRSRSEDYARPQYAYEDSPQYRTTSPDIRRTCNHSPRRRRPVSRNSPMRDQYGNITNMHRLPPSEPIYQDIEEERIHSRSLSPVRQSPATSTERVNLYASPFHTPVYQEVRIESRSHSPARRSPAVSRERANLYLTSFQSPAEHRQASIERLAVKAAASKPTTRGPPSPQRLEERAMAHSHADSLLMFSDPYDAESALTGWSQQELIKKKRKEEAREARRKEKRYGKKKDRKKPETRILNMPPIRNATNSPSRRKTYRGIDPLANDLEQKPRNLISRFATGRTSRTVALAPASSCIDRISWRITPTFSQSDGEMESTQSSNGSQDVPEVDNNVTYASLPITPSQRTQTDADIHAQATGEWMRSTEKTAAAQLMTGNDAAENSDFSGDVPLDESFQNSSIGSDDERPRPLEEDGSFPRLRDPLRIPCGERGDGEENEVHHYVESVTKQDDHYRTAGYNVSPPAVRQLSSTGDVCDTSDKISEESPVSVMAVHRAELQRLHSVPSTPTRQNYSHQPRSILRRGKHSAAHTVQDYHSIIADVRSHRVRFHDGGYRNDREATPENISNVRSGLHPSTEPNGFGENDSPPSEVASFTPQSPPRHREELDEDGRIPLSPIEEEHSQYEPGGSDLADDNFGTDDYPYEPEKDKDLGVEYQQQAFDDPAVYGREVDCESMISEFSEFGFMEAVAAIVIQTAVRRMLAINSIEKMLHKTYPLDEEQFETMAVYMQDLAAIQIQAGFRGWWVRDSLNVDHFCARRIQRAYRSFRTRMSFIFDVYRIIIIQSIWRGKIARDEAKQLRRVRRSQSLTPCWQSSKVRHFLKEKAAIEDAAAVVIQSRWRAYDAHMIYLYNLSSIMVIQSIARRWLTITWLDRYLTSIDPPAKRSLEICDEVRSRRKHSSEGHTTTSETSRQFAEGRAWAARYRVPTYGIPEHSIESPPMAAETDDEAAADAQHHMSLPKMENPRATVNKEDIMTREKVREANERDRKNAKMSGSVANFWKTQDKSSASKVLYHRKDMKPDVYGLNNGERIPESNKLSFVQADENTEQVNAVEGKYRGNPQKTESPPPTEGKEANVDEQRSSEMKSSPLPTETDVEAMADAQHRISQSEMENLATRENKEKMATREKVLGANERDRHSVKMSGLEDFWKSQDKSSASRSLYRRREGQVNVVEEKDRSSPQETEVPLLTESKARTFGVQRNSSSEKMESLPLVIATDNETAADAQPRTNPQKTEDPPPPVIEEANELDRTNAKMSGSVANFWKSKDQGSASKALYRRKDMRPAKQTSN